MTLMEIAEYCSIPVIVALCYGLVELLKRAFRSCTRLKSFFPLIAGITGTVLGVVGFFADPELMPTDSLLGAALAGMASGLSATGGHQIVHQITKKKTAPEDDDSPPKFYITGDKHRHFDRLTEFCQTHALRKKDVIVILGDSGLNYFEDKRDDALKERLSRLNVTLFSLHGNKENRPENIPTYGIRTFCGGTVYYEPRYPNLLFAKDGEIYNFNGKEFMVVGGAHSVDKIRCLEEELPFWEDEMPSEETKALVEHRLAARGYRIDGFLTHTCPISCLPTEMFISTKRAADESKQSPRKKKKAKPEYPIDIDRSTEQWLEKLKQETDYGVWYCGHYHIDKQLGDVHMMHKEIEPFCAEEPAASPSAAEPPISASPAPEAQEEATATEVQTAESPTVESPAGEPQATEPSATVLTGTEPPLST